MKKIQPIRISRKEVLASVRIPLPAKTGGRHKDRRDVSRQKQKINLTRDMRSEW